MKGLRCCSGVLLAVGLAACGSAPGETMDSGEAKERAREYAEESVAALPGGAEVELSEDDVGAGCDDRRVQLESYAQSFTVTGVPEKDEEEAFDRITGYWDEQGYAFLDDQRPEEHSVRYENEVDAFILVARLGREGELSITANSPCIWRDGQPPE